MGVVACELPIFTISALDRLKGTCLDDKKDGIDACGKGFKCAGEACNDSIKCAGKDYYASKTICSKPSFTSWVKWRHERSRGRYELKPKSLIQLLLAAPRRLPAWMIGLFGNLVFMTMGYNSRARGVRGSNMRVGLSQVCREVAAQPCHSLPWWELFSWAEYAGSAWWIWQLLLLLCGRSKAAKKPEPNQVLQQKEFLHEGSRTVHRAELLPQRLIGGF